jgi:RNA polymerase sigma factor (sigma-70 family)
MGAVAVDVNAVERKLEVLYPMHTKEGVETFLEQLPYIQESMYLTGDYDALIMIIDFQTALAASKLSEREQEIINLVFIEDQKRVDVAKLYGVTKQTVQKQIERAINKLANYYAEIGDEDAGF